MTPTNAAFQPLVETPDKLRQDTSERHYRRRINSVRLFHSDLDQTFQGVNTNRNKGYSQTSSASEWHPNQEILDPAREDGSREFPDQKDQDDINPNRNVPEEDNDLNDEDGAFIKEPNRELDDPYLPGHVDEENIPPIKKEFLDSDPD